MWVLSSSRHHVSWARRKTSSYSVIIYLNKQGDILDGNCECPAGKLACNHLMGMLRMIKLMQCKGFSEAPEHLSCTDLPQQWRVPRKTSIKGCSIEAVDWRSVREGGMCTPKLARPEERQWYPHNEEQQEAAIWKFASRLLSLDPGNEFAEGLLLTPLQPFKKTQVWPCFGSISNGIPARTAAIWFYRAYSRNSGSTKSLHCNRSCSRFFQWCQCMQSTGSPQWQSDSGGELWHLNFTFYKYSWQPFKAGMFTIFLQRPVSSICTSKNLELLLHTTLPLKYSCWRLCLAIVQFAGVAHNSSFTTGWERHSAAGGKCDMEKRVKPASDLVKLRCRTCQKRYDRKRPASHYD